MKILGYVVFCIVVLIVSIYIHRPASVERQKTRPQTTQTQEPLPLSTTRNDNDHDQGKRDSVNSDGNIRKLPGLPDKERALPEQPQTELQITKTQNFPPFTTVPGDNDNDKNLSFGDSPFGDVSSDDLSLDGFGHSDFGEENPFLEGYDHGDLSFDGFSDEGFGDKEE